MRRLLRIFRGRRWVPALVWAAAVLFVSSLPRMGVGLRLFPGCDKLLHFIEYLILGVTLRYWSGESRKAFVAGGLGFGALDEWHQRFIPGREASFWDFLADAGGILVGYLLVGRLLKVDRDE